jgi:hypothetical protein
VSLFDLRESKEYDSNEIVVVLFASSDGMTAERDSKKHKKNRSLCLSL